MAWGACCTLIAMAFPSAASCTQAMTGVPHVGHNCVRVCARFYPSFILGSPCGSSIRTRNSSALCPHCLVRQKRDRGRKEIPIDILSIARLTGNIDSEWIGRAYFRTDAAVTRFSLLELRRLEYKLECTAVAVTSIAYELESFCRFRHGGLKEGEALAALSTAVHCSRE
jgi:hypothetical protein